MKKSKKKYWLTLMIVSAVYLLYALFTGGIIVINLKWFGGLKQVEYVKGIKGNIAINSNYLSRGLPFIGFYDSTSLPSSLNIGIWDTSKQFFRMTINTISVEYANGKKEHYKMNWVQYFEPCILSNNSSGKTVETSGMMLNGNTPKCINYYSDCDVTITGYVETFGKKKIPFVVKEHFEFEEDLYLSTLWESYASC
jgi:hypothetical protein